jgi:thioredoxin-related protein
MRLQAWHQLFLSSLITLSFGTGAWAHPEVFSEYSLDQAKQEAQKGSKFLLIDFTATWCPPCRKMETTTWTDSAVQAWIKENAIAIQIDVDKDEKASAKLNVTAMPTMVLFTPESGAREFGRQVGYMSSSEMLQWLEGAKSGKSGDELEKEKEQTQSGDAEIWTHISKAREMQSAGQNAEALEEFVWLWDNIEKCAPSLIDLRISMVPCEVKKLCAVHLPAKTKFAELRDAAEKANNRKDWIILNGVLEENARTLTWFDKSKTDPKQRDAIKALTPQLEPVLYSNSRWADAANFLYPDPLAIINEYYKKAEAMKKPRPDTEVSKDFDPFPSMVLLLYGAYIGAGRDVEAQKIADECLRLDNTSGMRDALNNMDKGMKAARSAQSKAAK